MKKRKKKKNRLSTVIIVLVFIIGFSVLLYPTVSNLVNMSNQTRAIAGYRERIGSLRQDEYDEILEEAKKYNEAHRVNSFLVSDEEAADEEYKGLLSVDGSSLMGYLEITKTGTKLGIYHGVDETVLQVGIGHLPQTSLPVGGEGTHCVISGHTGLPSANLLSDLDRIEIGDTFRLYIMGEVLEYEVDQIKVVEPTDIAELQIVDGEDYVTIITCTPYGINSHRLLVRGHAAAWSGVISESGKVTADAVLIDPVRVMPYVAVPVMVIATVFILVCYNAEKKRKILF